MATTFTLGSVTYAPLASGVNKYGIAIFPDAAVYDILRYHVKGPDGNFIVRCGKSGGKIRAIVRYIQASEDACQAAFKSDADTFANAAIQITNSGATYARCNLDPGSARILKPVKPMGNGTGNAWMDAEFIFTQDA